jgi:hypothetical protein
MDVNTLRARVVELSHSGASLASAVDVDLNVKALGWLNSAYHELMDEVVPYLPQTLQKQVDVLTNTTGVAVLPEAPYRVLQVVVRGSGARLSVATPLEFMQADPTGTQAGSAQRVLIQGTTLTVKPAEMVTLGIVYVPAAADLVEGGAESSIVLPPVHHHALVWGGLVWSALYERGFLSQSEVVMYQRQWEAAKERVKLSLLPNLGAGLRVEPYTYV